MIRNKNFLSDDVIKRNLVHIVVPEEIYDIFAKQAKTADVSMASIFSRFLMSAKYEDFKTAVDEQEDFTGTFDITSGFDNQKFRKLLRYAKKLGVPVNQMVKQYTLYHFRDEYEVSVRYSDPIMYVKYIRVEPSFKKAIMRLQKRYNKNHNTNYRLSRFIVNILTDKIDISDINYKSKRYDTDCGDASIYLSFTEEEHRYIFARAETCKEFRRLIARYISKDLSQ
jgi:hypothetical protein